MVILLVLSRGEISGEKRLKVTKYANTFKCSSVFHVSQLPSEFTSKHGKSVSVSDSMRASS
jgi:hypothetical protein